MDHTFSVDDAVNKVGYGKFQMILTFLAGLGWFADAAEVFILSVLGEFIACDWIMHRWELALLTSFVFVGMMIGSPLFGTLADKYGRKTSLTASIAGTFVFGALSAASPSYTWLVIIRFCMGISLGGINQGLTLCSEYCPVEMRAKAGYYLVFFWSLGTIGVILLAWVIMEYLHNWRVLLALSSVPALIVILSLHWYPESARFYLVSNQRDKAVEILEKMAKMNNSDLPYGQLIEASVNTKRGSIRDLLSKEYRMSTLVFWFLWVAMAFAYFGMAFVSPIIVRRGGIALTSEEEKQNMSSIVPCAKFTTQNYVDLLWTSSAELPGIIAFALLVECCSRRILLGVSCIISGILTLLLLIRAQKIIILILLFGVRGLLLASYNLVLIMTSEVFPTTMRALAVGTGSTAGRISGLIVPYVSQVLMAEYPVAAICILSLLTVLSAVAAQFIPETRGKHLKETVNLEINQIKLPDYNTSYM